MLQLSRLINLPPQRGSYPATFVLQPRSLRWDFPFLALMPIPCPSWDEGMEHFSPGGGSLGMQKVSGWIQILPPIPSPAGAPGLKDESPHPQRDPSMAPSAPCRALLWDHE